MFFDVSVGVRIAVRAKRIRPFGILEKKYSYCSDAARSASARDKIAALISIIVVIAVVIFVVVAVVIAVVVVVYYCRRRCRHGRRRWELGAHICAGVRSDVAGVDRLGTLLR